MSGACASGVYEIANLVNGKRYIGSATNFRGRWNVHRSDLRKGKHHSKKLQHAWNKYGAEAFRFGPLLLCSKPNLIFFEQRCLDGLRPEYNIATVAGSILGMKLSPERIEKAAAVDNKLLFA